jgi:hypothetical protein
MRHSCSWPMATPIALVPDIAGQIEDIRIVSIDHPPRFLCLRIKSLNEFTAFDDLAIINGMANRNIQMASFGTSACFLTTRHQDGQINDNLLYLSSLSITSQSCR